MGYTTSEVPLDSFTCNLSELKLGETYYVKAYALNDSGTGYGNIVKLDFLKKLTIGGSFSVYDRQKNHVDSATIDTNDLYLIGVIEGDSVELVDIVVVFSRNRLGTDIPVIIKNAGLGGPNANKYYLSMEDAPETTADLYFFSSIEESTENHIIIYPNPFLDEIYIKNLSPATRIILTDLSGRIVQIERFENNSLNTRNLPRGIYLLTVEFENATNETIKLIKQ